jgi:hypothetical protein
MAIQSFAYQLPDTFLTFLDGIEELSIQSSAISSLSAINGLNSIPSKVRRSAEQRLVEYPVYALPRGLLEFTHEFVGTVLSSICMDLYTGMDIGSLV